MHLHISQVQRIFGSAFAETGRSCGKINCGADIRRITGQGKCAVILAVESGAALGGRIERIDDLAESGVKS